MLPLPCSLRRWNRGEPKKLFLMMFNRFLHGLDDVLVDGCIVCCCCCCCSFDVVRLVVAVDVPPECAWCDVCWWVVMLRSINSMNIKSLEQRRLVFDLFINLQKYYGLFDLNFTEYFIFNNRWYNLRRHSLQIKCTKVNSRQCLSSKRR